MKTYKQLQEVLKKSDDISKWISDFVHSDNPKFAGKSKEERIKMAKGAYYGAQNEEVELDEDADFIQQHLANKDINSSVEGKTVKVHSSDVAAAKKHLAKIGYKDHNVVSGLNEEVEQIDELNKSTLANYAKKSHDQLMKHTASVNFKYGRRDDDAFSYEHDKDNMRKTVNRTKGLHQAISKLAKEEIELDESYRLPSDSEVDKVKAHVKANHPDKSISQIAVHRKTKKIEYVVKDKEGKMSGHTLGEAAEQLDELSKDTLTSYVGKSFAVGNELHKQIKDGTGDKQALRDKISKRNQGVITAVKKLKKEENEMLTYSQFMEKLAESRIDDLRDKQAAEREAKKDAYEAGEKEKSKSAKRIVKGHSYGAGEDGDEDEDEKKKPSEPAVKRGRGRPAGSKSGARV